MTHSEKSSSREPAEVAIHPNYWTITIRDLDSIIDRITVRTDRIAEGGRHQAHVGCLREALAIVRGVRNRMLAENYDANRTRTSVRHLSYPPDSPQSVTYDEAIAEGADPYEPAGDE